MFLKDDRHNAIQEMKCYAYCKEVAQLLVEQGRYTDAITYHHNMIRSIEELKKLQNKKATYDQATIMLKQIETSQQHHNLLKSLGVAK